jgi:hypothetical protein
MRSIRSSGWLAANRSRRFKLVNDTYGHSYGDALLLPSPIASKIGLGVAIWSPGSVVMSLRLSSMVSTP